MGETVGLRALEKLYQDLYLLVTLWAVVEGVAYCMRGQCQFRGPTEPNKMGGEAAIPWSS